MAIAYLFLIGITGVRVGIRNGSITISILGILSAILMIFMGYQAFINPYFGVVSDGKPFLPGIAYIVSLIGLGAVIYIISRTMNYRRGINIDLNFKEIPPE